MEIDIEYLDREGDIMLIEGITSLKEAKEEIKKILADDGEIRETWKYVDGVYKGGI